MPGFYARFRLLEHNAPAVEIAAAATALVALKQLNALSEFAGKGRPYRLQGWRRADGTRRVWWDL